MSTSRSTYRSLSPTRLFPVHHTDLIVFPDGLLQDFGLLFCRWKESGSAATSASLVGFISSVHFYAYALMQPVSGILHDRYGPVRVVTCGLLLTAASCLLLTIVRTPFTLGVWRLISGSASLQCTPRRLSFWPSPSPAERYCFYAGINFAVSSLGAIVSVAPLGFALDTFGIPSTFAILAGTSFSWQSFWRAGRSRTPCARRRVKSNLNQ